MDSQIKANINSGYNQFSQQVLFGSGLYDLGALGIIVIIFLYFDIT